MKKEDIEIMAPAGSYEALRAAIQGGANSIYFGIEQLNMRARASNNFTLEDLKEIASICNKSKIRSYITLNTILYDHDISLMKNIVKTAKESGISAIIAADQAAINYANSIGMEVHISTQANVTNAETVKFYSHFADVMVLSRELSLKQVHDITKAVKREKIKGPSGKPIEIEIFVHGALCMAVSGKCYLSLHTYNSSANRGACNQNCRHSYEVIDTETGEKLEIDNEYIMSPKDLCTIGFIDQVIDAGVRVLKIEGRGRAPEYVKTTTQCYREAVDSYFDGSYSQEKVDAWMKRLETVFNRGFWDGYYLGQRLGEWTNRYGSSATKKKIYLGKGTKYFPQAGVGEFSMESHTLEVGDEILVTGPTTGVLERTIEELRVNFEKVEKASKGDVVSIFINERIRPSDRLYKVVDA